MNDYKIKKANEIYAKLQGAYWAREKCEEYGQYGQCENIRELVSRWHKELEGLELTQEEKQMVGYEFVDNDLAVEWHYKLRG